MNARQLVQATLKGETTPRYPCGPLAVHYTATLAGVSIRDYTLDPHCMVDCITRYYERFRPDAVWLSADTWVTAEAMGAEVAFPDDHQPLTGTGKGLVQFPRDIDAIPPADPSTQGRMPLMLEGLRLLRERLGNEVFIVACFDQSPFSVACALADMSSVMLKLYDDRAFVEALLERAVEYGIAYAKAMGSEGADLLSTGDSPAGLLGAGLYREVALPAERRVFKAVAEACDVPVSLHICGKATHLLPDIARSGARVLELDEGVKLEEACQVVPDDIALWGNLDPVRLLKDGTPAEVEAAAQKAAETCRRQGRRRFVLSSGCTLCPDTPPENIEALVETARARCF